MKRSFVVIVFTLLILYCLQFYIFVYHGRSVMAVEKNHDVLSQSAMVSYDLPYPGILPDNPLYIFKVIRDRIVLIFTKDPVRKIELKILFADKRLVMGDELIRKGKVKLGATTISKGEKYLLEASNELETLNTTSHEVDVASILDRLLVASGKHQEVITEIFEMTNVSERRSLGLSSQFAKEVMEKLQHLKENRK